VKKGIIVLPCTLSWYFLTLSDGAEKLAGVVTKLAWGQMQPNGATSLDPR